MPRTLATAFASVVVPVVVKLPHSPLTFAVDWTSVLSSESTCSNPTTSTARPLTVASAADVVPPALPVALTVTTPVPTMEPVSAVETFAVVTEAVLL
jgi:hypothetical protein